MTSLPSRSRVIFATFATEGPPFDKGLPISDCLPPFIAKVIESGVDQVLSFTPRSLVDIFGEEAARHYTRNLGDPPGLISKSYFSVGAGAWKAEIIKFVVDTHKDGDIVMFHDANWKKYPGILTGFAPQARDYATAAISAADRTKIFAPPHVSLIYVATRSVFERLRDPSKTGYRHSKLIYQPAGRARCIVLQINPETREFARKFAEACNVDENLNGGPDGYLPRGGWSEEGFGSNVGEQAVFNALIYGGGLWDVTKDEWILPLQNIGFHDHDSGSKALFEWVKVNRGWKSDRESS